MNDQYLKGTSLENKTSLHKMGKQSFLGTPGMLSPRHPINTFDKLCAVKYTTRFSHPSAGAYRGMIFQEF